MNKDKLKKQIITKVDINKRTGCWEFNGCVQSNGYSRLTHQRKTMGGHRWSYLAFKGEIPYGMDVMHKCDNRRCVNPLHLTVGTRLDNMADAVSKGRQAKGFSLKQTVLSESDIIQAAEMRRKGMLYKDIGKKFGVCRQTISFAIRKRGLA